MEEKRRMLEHFFATENHQYAPFQQQWHLFRADFESSNRLGRVARANDLVLILSPRSSAGAEPYMYRSQIVTSQSHRNSARISMQRNITKIELLVFLEPVLRGAGR